jgi:hypothetical protein
MKSYRKELWFETVRDDMFLTLYEALVRKNAA